MEEEEGGITPSPPVAPSGSPSEEGELSPEGNFVTVSADEMDAEGNVTEEEFASPEEDDGQRTGRVCDNNNAAHVTLRDALDNVRGSEGCLADACFPDTPSQRRRHPYHTSDTCISLQEVGDRQGRLGAQDV